MKKLRRRYAKLNEKLTTTLQVSYENVNFANLRKSYLADLQKIYENLKTNLGKMLRKSYEVSKIGPVF